MKALRGFGSVSGRPDHRPRSKRIVLKGLRQRSVVQAFNRLTVQRQKKFSFWIESKIENLKSKLVRS
jgi:hypothetical protein